MFRSSRILGLTCFLALSMVAQKPEPPLTVSLVQLIATPERFDGKLVSVQGFLSMDREGDLLYLSQGDAENGLLPNAIWVRRTEEMGRDRQMLNTKYVKIVGTFQANFKEQLGIPKSGIPDVRRVDFWSDPSHPMALKIREIPGVK